MYHSVHPLESIIFQGTNIRPDVTFLKPPGTYFKRSKSTRTFCITYQKNLKKHRDIVPMSLWFSRAWSLETESFFTNYLFCSPIWPQKRGDGALNKLFFTFRFSLNIQNACFVADKGNFQQYTQNRYLDCILIVFVNFLLSFEGDQQTMLLRKIQKFCSIQLSTFQGKICTQ